MKFLLTFLLQIVILSSVGAQFFMPLNERVEKAKTRILLIEQGDFECSDEVESYFKKHWTFGAGVEIKTADEISSLLTPETAFNYMVLTGDQKMEAKIDGSLASPVIGMVLYLGENAFLRNEITIDRKFVFKVSFPSCVVSEAEVVFICDHFNNYLNDPTDKNQKKSVIAVEKTKSLEQLTLLVPANSTELGLSAIKKAYKYPVNVVSAAEVEKKVLEKDAGFAYVNIIWSDKRFAWVSIVVSCETSEVLAAGKSDYFKAAVNKKKFDKTQQPFAVCRSKSKLGAYEFKQLNKTVLTAIQGQ